MFRNFCKGRKSVDVIQPTPSVKAADATAKQPSSSTSVTNVDTTITLQDAGSLYDLRKGGHIPTGACMYIQSGDTSDFDGYLIAAAGHVLQTQTAQLDYVIAVPERRACRDKDEPDTMKHDPSYLEEVMATSGTMLRQLCPEALLCRGLLNQRNIIPWKMMFNEPECYGPLLEGMPPVDIRWSPLKALADRILSPELQSVLIDMNGSMGYLDGLVQELGPQGQKVLGAKMRASGFPVVIMAGVQAEVPAQTLPLPGRDPRATKNAIYYPDAVRVLLRLAKEHSLPLLFVTNNTCNRLMKFQDAPEVELQMELKGLLKDIGNVWFSMPHLQGKCVPFDWVAFSAMLLYGRKPTAMRTARQELWVGKADASVLVLRDAGQPKSEVVAANLDNTEMWGTVETVEDISLDVLLKLARHATAHAAA